MSIRIFVSHSSSDVTKFATIRDLAAQAGVDLYFAEHDFQPGTALAEKVLGQLKSCQAFLVLLSPESAASPYVQQEIGAAIVARLVTIPLVEPSVPQSALAMLEGREYIPFDPKDPVGVDPEGLAELGRLGARLVLQRSLEEEVTAFLGRARYVRTGESRWSRNGNRPRRVQTAEGEWSARCRRFAGAPSGSLAGC